jgi:hypothetical protein
MNESRLESLDSGQRVDPDETRQRIQRRSEERRKLEA